MWKTFQAANISFLTTFFCWVSLSGIMAFYISIYLVLINCVPQNIFRPIFAGCIWVLLDILKGVALTGFPWALISHTQYKNPNMVLLSSLFSSHGITFFIIAVNEALSFAYGRLLAGYQSISRHSIVLYLKSFYIIPLLILAMGAVHLRQKYFQTNKDSVVRIAILQGNIYQYEKWNDQRVDYIKSTYARLVEQAMDYHPDVIIWPESALPGWIPNDEALFSWIQIVIKKSHVHHIIGAVTERNGKAYNSAFFFDPGGRILEVYDKQHLVPFGEYIPFGRIFQKWIPYLGELGTFEAGEKSKLFSLRLKNGQTCHFVPNICYEALFPALVRKSVAVGGDIIVNLTNDAWYLQTGAPEQHFAVNIFRAAENNRPVIRCANTGISAYIDASGSVVARTKLIEEKVLFIEVPY